MSLSVSAVLSQSGTPRQVRVYVEGLEIGEPFRVTGTAGGHTWTVRGGFGDAATSQQLVLTDVLTPIDRAITYQVSSGDDVATAPTTVTVLHSKRYLLQDLSAGVVLGFAWLDNRDPISIRMDQDFHPATGRKNPVHRYARAGGQSGVWSFLCTPGQSRQLEALLESAEPVVLRCDGRIQDFPPIRVVGLGAPSSQLLTEEGDRVWSLPWTEVDDPLSRTVMVGDTWSDVDAAYEGDTWADLDAAYPGTTWGDWNRFDWAGAAL